MSRVLMQVGEPALFTLDWLRAVAPQIALIILLALVVSRAGKTAVRRMRRRLEGSATARQELTRQRSATLVTTMVSTVRIVVWTAAVLMILGLFRLNLAPLIAGAGIAGVALGFGAQSLVKDFLAGFFILLENQFVVGDAVEIAAVGGSVSGRVEAITFRTTAIRQADGTLSILPNGNIQLVSNKSRGRGELLVEVRVPLVDDPADMRTRLDDLVEEMRADPVLSARVSAGPTNAGVETVGEEAVVKVAVETRPSRRDEVSDEIRRRVQQRFLKIVATPEPGGGATP